MSPFHGICPGTHYFCRVKNTNLTCELKVSSVKSGKIQNRICLIRPRSDTAGLHDAVRLSNQATCEHLKHDWVFMRCRVSTKSLYSIEILIYL